MVTISLERSINHIKELADILSSLPKDIPLRLNASGDITEYTSFTVSKSEKLKLHSVVIDLLAALENIPDNPDVIDVYEGGE